MIENPIYGGAYAYGKSRSVPGYGGRSGIRRKSRHEWLALIPDAHEGYISWERAEEIRKMVSDNVPASRHRFELLQARDPFGITESSSSPRLTLTKPAPSHHDGIGDNTGSWAIV